jgi:hypothetical protein
MPPDYSPLASPYVVVTSQKRIRIESATTAWQRLRNRMYVDAVSAKAVRVSWRNRDFVPRELLNLRGVVYRRAQVVVTPEYEDLVTLPKVHTDANSQSRWKVLVRPGRLARRLAY